MDILQEQLQKVLERYFDYLTIDSRKIFQGYIRINFDENFTMDTDLEHMASMLFNCNNGQYEDQDFLDMIDSKFVYLRHIQILDSQFKEVIECLANFDDDEKEDFYDFLRERWNYDGDNNTHDFREFFEENVIEKDPTEHILPTPTEEWEDDDFENMLGEINDEFNLNLSDQPVKPRTVYKRLLKYL